MRRLPSFPGLSLFTLITLGAAGASVFAQAPPPESPRSRVVHFDAASLDGWIVDSRASRPPAVADGVITIDESSGWLRTRQTNFGTFTLRFSARVSSAKARAIVALLGSSVAASESAYAVLLSGAFPDPRQWPSARLNAYIPDERARAAAWSSDEWQHFELIRLIERVVVRLNERIILNIESPVTIDGWLGFRVQDGSLQLRDVELSEAPAVAPPAFFRPGPGITAPVLVKEVKPAYTEEGLRRRIEGTAIIEAVVDIDGTVKRPVVVRFLDPASGLDGEAVRAVAGWRFKPGTRAGSPVPVLVTFEISFSIAK